MLSGFKAHIGLYKNSLSPGLQYIPEWPLLSAEHAFPRTDDSPETRSSQRVEK